MRVFTCGAAALLVSLALASVTFAASIPITNPSFEQTPTPDALPGPGSFTYTDHIPGWAPLTAGDSGLTDSGSPFFNDGSITPNGTYVAFVQAAGPSPNTYGLSQTLPALTVGTQYTLTFDYNTRYAGIDNDITATLGDHSLFSTDLTTQAGSGHPWFAASLTFTADAGDATGPLLTFAVFGPRTDSSVTLLLDNISLTFVPEPGSFVLFGLGAVGLLLAARRRRIGNRS